MTDADKTDAEEPVSFEDAFTRLESVVRRLRERPDVARPIDRAI